MRLCQHNFLKVFLQNYKIIKNFCFILKHLLPVQLYPHLHCRGSTRNNVQVLNLPLLASKLFSHNSKRFLLPQIFLYHSGKWKILAIKTKSLCKGTKMILNMKQQYSSETDFLTAAGLRVYGSLELCSVILMQQRRL